MSGGVDSSVAAALLLKQRYEVVGVHLKCYNVDGCAVQDAEDARRAAETLGIPFYVLDFEKEYKDAVVKYMIDGYKKGITPNPDVMCNKEIKFGLFLKKALEMGADYVATGHYIKIQNSKFKNQNDYSKYKVSYRLLEAKDKNKDQSYFLWTLTQEQLKHCLFPIGEYTKPEVRKLAKKFRLPNAEKKDSQGICFLGQVSLPEFLQKYIKPRKGYVVNIDGKIIGEHNGAHFYTIGQRSGLGIGGYKKPLYIADKNIKKNIIIVAEGDDHPALYKKEVELTNVNFLNDELRGKNKELRIPVMARVRYRQPLTSATLALNHKRYTLFFKKPMKFIAEGQSAVFYDKKGMMLGGGVIKSVR